MSLNDKSDAAQVSKDDIMLGGIIKVPMRMFRFSDDCPPWVIALDEADAMKWLECDERFDRGHDYGKPVAMPDAEYFTMCYEDVPEELTPDEECECTPEILDKYGCDCEAQFNQVTLTTAEWCALGDKYRERVIWEFQG